MQGLGQIQKDISQWMNELTIKDLIQTVGVMVYQYVLCLTGEVKWRDTKQNTFLFSVKHKYIA